MGIQEVREQDRKRTSQAALDDIKLLAQSTIETSPANINLSAHALIQLLDDGEIDKAEQQGQIFKEILALGTSLQVMVLHARWKRGDWDVHSRADRAKFVQHAIEYTGRGVSTIRDIMNNLDYLSELSYSRLDMFDLFRTLGFWACRQARIYKLEAKGVATLNRDVETAHKMKVPLKRDEIDQRCRQLAKSVEIRDTNLSVPRRMVLRLDDDSRERMQETMDHIQKTQSLHSDQAIIDFLIGQYWMGVQHQGKISKELDPKRYG
jgi:hypothetical protein